MPLVGGYVFAVIWNGSLYHASRESGHRLYFRAIFYGAFLLGCALLIHALLLHYSDWYPLLHDYSNSILTAKGATTWWHTASWPLVAILSFLLGPILGQTLNLPTAASLLNLQIPGTNKQPFMWWARKLLDHAIQNNDFEKLVLRSFDTNLPILLTLKTGQVYAGWAVRAPNPVQERKFLRILPLLSGYRDNHDRQVHFTTHYYDALHNSNEDSSDLSHLELQDFEAVIPLDQIINAHLFDLVAYEHLTPDEQDQ